jgi:hypothetical protein
MTTDQQRVTARCRYALRSRMRFDGRYVVIGSLSGMADTNPLARAGA